MSTKINGQYMNGSTFQEDIVCEWVHFFKGQVFVCVEVLRPSQPNRVMSSAVNLPNHTFTRQA